MKPREMMSDWNTKHILSDELSFPFWTEVPAPTKAITRYERSSLGPFSKCNVQPLEFID